MSGDPWISGRHPTHRPRISTDAFLEQLDAPAWMNASLCAQTDPESFFPDKGGSTREAKAVCGRCAVAAECLDYAIENQERWGIWGGLSERERRKLTKALGIDENPPPTEGTAA